jgi:hypothetical protein
MKPSGGKEKVKYKVKYWEIGLVRVGALLLSHILCFFFGGIKKTGNDLVFRDCFRQVALLVSVSCFGLSLSPFPLLLKRTSCCRLLQLTH